MSPLRSSHRFVLTFALAATWLACTGGGGSTDAVEGPDSGASSSGASSSSSSGSSSGDAAPTKATPQVIFDGQLALGTTTCKEVGSLFKVGDFGSSAANPPVAARPVKDGESDAGRAITVRCSVTPGAAGTFAVNASVTAAGALGGTFTIDGNLTAQGDQANIHVAASKTSGSSYEQTACTVSYTTISQGVAAGRVWGEVTCPSAEGTAHQSACKVIAQFRFENCAQQ